MTYRTRARQRGRYIGPVPESFRLSCEVYPYPAGTRRQNALADSAGQAKLTLSSVAACRRYQDRSMPTPEGIGALYNGATTDNVSFPYVAQSAVKKGYGTAIKAGDFFIGFWVTAPNTTTSLLTNGSSLISVTGTSSTAANTAFIFRLSASGQLTFIISDGTTLFTFTTVAVFDKAAGPKNHYYVAAERRDGWIYVSVEGVVYLAIPFSANINVPAGTPVMQLGAEPGANGFLGGLYLDMVQIMPFRHMFWGTSFTPPTWPQYFRGPRKLFADPSYPSNTLVLDLASSSGHGITNDLSFTPCTVTNFGSVTQSTTNADPYGDGLGNANGFSAANWIKTNRKPLVTTGDITMEVWVYRTGAGGGGTLRLISAQDGGNPVCALVLDSSFFVTFVIRDVGGATIVQLDGTVAVALNTWTHCAAVRKAGTMGVFTNGVANGTATISANIAGAGIYEVGGLTIATGQYFAGSLRGARVTEGVARYTPGTNFTVQPYFYPLNAGTLPALTAPTWDKVALAMDGETTNDTSPFEWHTAAGSVTADTAQFKFGTKSLNMAGSGTGLHHSYSIPQLRLQVATTIGFWFRPANVTTSMVLVSQRDNASTGNGWFVAMNSTGTVYMQTTSAVLQTALPVFVANTWHHLLFVFNGGVLYIFVNGALIISGVLTIANLITSTEGLQIGATAAAGSSLLNGWIDDLFITQEALTMKSFAVPTAALVGSQPSGYSGWSATDKGAAITVSTGGRNASSAASTNAVRGTQGRATGTGTDYYFEISSAGGNTAPDQIVLGGVGKATAGLTNFPGSDANGYGFYPNGPSAFNNNSSAAYGAACDTIGVWMRSDGTLRYKTSAFDPTTNANTGLSGTYYPMWGQGSAAGTRDGAINTGATAFKWGLPAGATAWG